MVILGYSQKKKKHFVLCTKNQLDIQLGIIPQKPK